MDSRMQCGTPERRSPLMRIKHLLGLAGARVSAVLARDWASGAGVQPAIYEPSKLICMAGVGISSRGLHESPYPTDQGDATWNV